MVETSLDLSGFKLEMVVHFISSFLKMKMAPGAETFSRVVAGGLVDGWNEFDLLADELSVSTFGLE